MLIEQTEKIAYLTQHLHVLQRNKHVIDLQIANDNKAATERGSLVVADAKIHLDEKIVPIHIGLDGNFPQSLPIILLQSDFLPKRIPHIEPDGFVCYSDKENLVIDSSVPETILVEAIERTKVVLQSGFSGENKWDFIDEFDAYWRSYHNAFPAKSLINPSAHARQIVVARSSRKSDGIDIAYVSDNDSTPIEYGMEPKVVTRENGIYVPLQKGTFLDVFSEPNLTARNIRRAVLNSISPSNRRLLKRFTKKYKRNEVVVFGLPRPSGGEVLFGIQFSVVHTAHPLQDQGNAEDLIPIALQRLDRTYLLPRGGASQALHNKRIVLVGCGAVGGQIAVQLVQSGILNLTLIDHDLFTHENIFRHVLGKEYVGQSKVDALRMDLESRFPYIKINTLSLKVEEAVAKSILDLGKFDLAIMATGDENISLMMNRVYHAKDIRTPILYSWLEPYGIGGHVLVTNIERKGCLQCLFTPMQPDDEFSNRASFVAPGQRFTKDTSGCANRFTPYSSLDASNTASLAVRTARKVLSGKITTNSLYSWKGESDDLTNGGFQVSDRHTYFDVTSADKGVEVHNPGCTICG